MKRQPVIAALLFVWCSLAGATDDLPDQVIWGLFCGECAGECATMREIVPGRLSIDRSSRFLHSTPIPSAYVFDGQLESSSEYEKYQWLLEQPVPSIMKIGETVFGEPDAYDQCGYYLKYRIGDVEYGALIDTTKVPGELAPIIRKLF